MAVSACFSIMAGLVRSITFYSISPFDLAPRFPPFSSFHPPLFPLLFLKLDLISFRPPRPPSPLSLRAIVSHLSCLGCPFSLACFSVSNPVFLLLSQLSLSLLWHSMHRLCVPPSALFATTRLPALRSLPSQNSLCLFQVGP